jgi:hypothetical protein
MSVQGVTPNASLLAHRSRIVNRYMHGPLESEFSHRHPLLDPAIRPNQVDSKVPEKYYTDSNSFSNIIADTRGENMLQHVLV